MKKNYIYHENRHRLPHPNQTAEMNKHVGFIWSVDHLVFGKSADVEELLSSVLYLEEQLCADDFLDPFLELSGWQLVVW